MQRTYKISTLIALLATGAAAVDLQYCRGGVAGLCQNITLTTPTVKTCFARNATITTIDTVVGLTLGVRYTVHTAVGCTAASSSATFGTGTNTLIAPFLNTVQSISASIVWNSVGTTGCFTDLNAGARTLAGGFTSSPNMTIDTCQNFCDAGGFVFSGVEFGTECYCDYFVQVSGTTAPITECNVPCGGKPGENCGGASRLNIFTNGKAQPTTPATVAGPNATVWTSQGCFTDNSIGVRTLPLHIEPATGGVTPQTCVATCAAAGQTIAGVEFGDECWCGTVRNPNATVVAAAQCGTACTANTAFFCGGANRINIFNRPAA